MKTTQSKPLKGPQEKEELAAASPESAQSREMLRVVGAMAFLSESGSLVVVSTPVPNSSPAHRQAVPLVTLLLPRLRSVGQRAQIPP